MESIFSKYADVHTHNLNAGSDAIVNLPIDADVPAEGSFSVGVHPWHADEPIDWDALRRKAANPRVVAIGETGLDKLRGAPMQIQEEVFLAHVRMSEELAKPLIIHAVGTYNRLVELRKSLRPTQSWLIHGFRGKPELATQLVRAGFEISLGAKYNPNVTAVIPPERLHHESD